MIDGAAPRNPLTRQVCLALVTVYLVWGSVYLAIRWTVQSMPPFVSAGGRFVVGGVLLGVISWVRGGRRAWTFDVERWRNAAGCGVLILAGGNGLIVLGETHVASGQAALLVATVPLWLIVLRDAIGDRTSRLTRMGVLVGLGGVALLLLPGSAGSHLDLGYALVLALAALLWAAGSVLLTRAPVPADPLVLASIEMLAAGVVLLVAAAGHGELSGLDLSAVSGRSWLALSYHLVFGSIIAFCAYSYALANAPTPLVATYAYVNPMVAVALGVLVGGERLTVSEIAGGLVIGVSVVVVVSAERRPRRRAAPVVANLGGRTRPVGDQAA